jgi:hypothetical protein
MMKLVPVLLECQMIHELKYNQKKRAKTFGIRFFVENKTIKQLKTFTLSLAGFCFNHFDHMNEINEDKALLSSSLTSKNYQHCFDFLLLLLLLT